jgi:RHS repeat-associated protein
VGIHRGTSSNPNVRGRSWSRTWQRPAVAQLSGQMKTQGVSFRHAVELLRSNHPSLAAGSGHVVRKGTTAKLESPVTSDADDQQTLHSVVEFYHKTLKESPEALRYLETLLVAEYGTPSAADFGTKYVSVDHLGSTRLVTDTAQNQEICYDFLPFGELIPTGTDGRSGCYGSTATPLTEKFTGKERDPETGLDFFSARYMSSAQGRFTSPDPAGNFVANAADPQSWNMYAYARNNPLAFVDPSGLDYCEDFDGYNYDSGDVNQQACDEIGGTWNEQPFFIDTAYSTNPSQATFDLGGYLSEDYGDLSDLNPLNSGFLFNITPINITPPTGASLLPNQPQTHGPSSPSTNGCLESFNNSTIGTVTNFFSPLNLLTHLKSPRVWAEWTLLPYGKAKILEAAGDMSAAIGNTEEFLSVAGASASVTITPPVTAAVATAEALAPVLALGIPVATAMDAGARSICSSTPNLRF